MRQRVARLREQLKEEVSDIIHRQMRDPRLGFVTITDAEVSDDLGHAKIFFTVYGDKEQVEQSTEALNSATGFVRSEIGSRIRIKFIPEISFHYDTTTQHAARIEELLNQISKQATEKSEEPKS